VSFQDFDLPRVQEDFGVTAGVDRSLFSEVAPVPLSAGLRAYWDNLQLLGRSLITEKARSEFLVAPLLGEVWVRSKRAISLLSGVPFTVDDSVGLNGVCDFVLCRSPMLFYITAPVLVAVEAKRDSIPDGLGQCAAEMVAAQCFNQKANRPIDPIYGS
jgi:hypothetical protein